jgi:hypothetical protein
MPVFGSGITVSATAPVDNIAISQTVLSTYSNGEGGPYEAIRKTANNASSWREVGQTFTVESSFTLDKISLIVSQSSARPASGLSLYMDVYSATSVSSHHGGSLTGYPDTGIMPLIPTTHSTAYPTPTPADALFWMTFDVANVALTPGIYGFRIGHDTPDFSLNYQLGESSLDIGGIYMHRFDPNLDPADVDIYAGGQAYRYHPFNGSLASGFTDGLTDLAFVLQSAAAQHGDFNTDGKVDAADYTTWRKNDLANSSLPNDNGLTTQSDRYALWRANFGLPATGSSALGEFTVPEPTLGVLTVLMGIWLLAVVRRPAGRAD